MDPDRGLPAEIDEAARELEASADFPSSYVALVRSRAARLSAPTVHAGDVRGALTLLEEYAYVDDEVPLEGRFAAIVHAKRLVRKATWFTTHHLANGVSSFGRASVWLGMTIAERLEQLESRLDDTAARTQTELAELQERVARLESGRR